MFMLSLWSLLSICCYCLVLSSLSSSSSSSSPLSQSPSSIYNSIISLLLVLLMPFGLLLLLRLVLTGLWTADLSITQLFLEAVVEEERGVVNGVQNALNKLMDVLKFLLVVLVPDTETFGFLILLSFLFVCMGWVLYAVFLRRERGHLLPKCCSCVAEYDEL